MEQIKTLLKWIGIPFLGLLGIVYALFKQNQGLKEELNNEKAERAVDGIKREISEAEKDADTKEADYITARDKYRSEHGDGS